MICCNTGGEKMKNITKFDINIQLELVKITTKKIKFSLLIVGIMLILFGISIYREDDVTGMGLAFGGLAVIIIFVLFWDKLMIKQFKNNNLLKGETYNYYEFNDNGFTADTIREEECIGKSNLKYTDIIKAVENKKFLVLFISNAQAFVISKNGMTEGRVEDLIILIKSRVTKYNILYRLKA